MRASEALSGTFKLIKIAPGTPRDVLVTRALMGQFEVISPFGGDDRGAHRLLHIKRRGEIGNLRLFAPL